jgi:hypothetical protein
VPDKLIVASAGLVIVIEVGLGVGLLFAAVRGYALVGSAGLLALYAGAMGVNLARGRRHIDCGCMGPAARQSLSGWLIARNLLLALVALAGLQRTVPRELYWLDLVSVAAAVSALVLIYAAINHLIANAPNLARLRN